MSAGRLGVMLDLEGRQVLVVGGGPVAARKVGRLLDAGARVHLVSPVVTEDLAAAAAAGRLVWSQRGAEVGDLEGARLVFLCSDRSDLHDQLARAAEARGAWVNRADQAGGGDFAVAAEARRGPVRLLVSTGGRSPALARALRARCEEVLAEGWDLAAEALGEVRAELDARGLDPDQRRRFWRRFPDPDQLQALLAGRTDDLRAEVGRCVASLSA